MKNTLAHDSVSALLGTGFAVGVGLLLGFLVVGVPNPLIMLAIAVGLLAAAIVVSRIEWALVLLVFITYTHLSNVAIEYHGVPSLAKIFVLLLIFGIIIRWVFYGEQPTGWGQMTLLMMIYGLVGIVSMVYAADIDRTIATLKFWVKDSIIAIIVVILLKRAEFLRRVVWALLAAGIFVGTIGVYQHLTGTFENIYWGFGQAVAKDIAGATVGYRIAGPIGAPNFFAQVLLVLVPLAIDRLWKEKTFVLRFMAAWALAVCTLSIFFTYSRGGFIALVMMLIVFMVLHPPRLKVIFISFAVAVPLLYFAPPQYFDRIITLRDVLPGTKVKDTSDDAFIGRKSEMLVAWRIFIDHPVRGIGLGNYEAYYQKYSRQIFLDSRLEGRKAHSRYLEILAETGLLGLAAFGLLLWMMFFGLWQARKATSRRGMTELEGIITAFGIGMVGFLTASTFLHDDYARYFWLLVGIAFAIPHIVRNEVMTQKNAREPVGAVSPSH